MFLEVKRRSNKGETSKVRARAGGWDEVMDDSLTTVAEVMTARDLRRTPPLTGDLEATLWNSYRRITFVRIDAPERVTFDSDLSFWTPDGRAELNGVVIAEVKQERLDRSSPVTQRLRTLGIRPVPFLGGAAVNLAAVLLIAAGIYYPRSRNRDYFFSFVAFNTAIYFVMAILTRVELGIGVGFGLFAIFSVLRYRTEATSFREMTYMFVIIALPVVNAVLMPAGDLTLALVADGLVIIVVFFLERGFGLQFEVRQHVQHDRLELIAPARRAELIPDLKERTGLPVQRVELGRINLVTDVADLYMIYTELRESRRGRPRSTIGSSEPQQLT